METLRNIVKPKHIPIVNYARDLCRKDSMRPMTTCECSATENKKPTTPLPRSVHFVHTFFYQKKKINKNTYFYYHQLIARGEPQKRIYYDEGSADVSASEWMSWHSGMAEKIERAKKTARLSILFVLVAYNDSLSRTSIDSRRRLLINRLVNLMNAREKRKSKKGEKKRSEKFWRMGWERW